MNSLTVSRRLTLKQDLDNPVYAKDLQKQQKQKEIMDKRRKSMYIRKNSLISKNFKSLVMLDSMNMDGNMELKIMKDEQFNNDGDVSQVLNQINYLRSEKGKGKRERQDLHQLNRKYYQGIMKGHSHIQHQNVDFNVDYINEYDKCMGDMVIVFSNPDYQGGDSKYMKLQDAFQIIEQCLLFSATNEDQKFKKQIIEAILIEYNKLGRIGDKEKPSPKPLNFNTDSQKINQQLMITYEHLDLLPYVKRRFNKGRLYCLLELNNRDKIWSKTLDIGQKNETNSMTGNSQKNNLLDDLNKDNEEEEKVKEEGDFLTIMRNTIQIILAEKLGIMTRNFMSFDGQYIFSVLSSSLNNTAVFTDLSDQYKKLKEECINVFSYEPVDSKYRPLRLNRMIIYEEFSKVEYQKNDIEKSGKKWEQLRDQIISLSKDLRIKLISRQIDQHLPGSKVPQIIQNKEVEIKTWKSYKLYLELLIKKVKVIQEEYNKEPTEQEIDQAAYLIRVTKSNKIYYRHKQNRKIPLDRPNTKVVKAIRREKLCQDYLKAFKDTIIECNQKSGGDKLKTIYDHYNQKQINCYFPYFQPKRHLNFQGKIRSDQIWEQYTVSYNMRKSHFDTKERLQQVNQMIRKYLNLDLLKDMDIIDDFYFMNDYIRLQGKKQNVIFQQDYKRFQDYLDQQLKIQNTLRIKQMIVDEQTKQEKYRNPNQVVIDFEKIKRNFKLQDLKSYDRMLIEKKKEQLKKSDFDVELNQNLYGKWPLNFLKPYNYPIAEISKYYGQNIGLFYKFKSYFIRRLLIISLITGTFQVIFYVFDQDLYPQHHYISFYFTRIILIGLIQFWGSYVIEQWSQSETQFAYEMGSIYQDHDQNRLNFTGEYVRSIANDNLNEQQTKPSSKMITQIVVYTFLALLVVGYIYMFDKIHGKFRIVHMNLGIDDSNGLLPNTKIQTFNKVFNIAMILMAFCILIINILVNFILRFICFVTTQMQNHKTEYDFEDSFNIQFFSLSLCTHFIPMVMQGVYYPLSDDTQCMYIEKGIRRCDYDLTSYFMFYSMMLTVWTTTYNILMYYGVRASLAFFNIQTRLIYKKLFANNESNLRNFAVRDNAYLNLNAKIISDKIKVSFNINQDMELITIEYNEIIINFSILICYGMIFPLVFLINFFIYCCFVSLDRNKLCFYYRRPLPKKANSIRKWYTMMQIVSLVSIPLNATTLTVTDKSNISAQNYQEYAQIRMQNFLMIMLVQAIIKTFIFFKYGTKDETFQMFAERSKFLTETNIARLRFDKITNNLKKSIPIYQLYGCWLDKQNLVYDVKFRMDNYDHFKDDIKYAKNGLKQKVLTIHQEGKKKQ